MDNLRITEILKQFKKRIQNEVYSNQGISIDMKHWLWKILIMTEVAHRSFELDSKIESFEKNYFESYSAVARYFRDWNMDWVADNYFEISNYIGEYYWPDHDKRNFDENYIQFKTFNL